MICKRKRSTVTRRARPSYDGIYVLNRFSDMSVCIIRPISKINELRIHRLSEIPLRGAVLSA